MLHLDDGVLRRLVDDPEEALFSARAHFTTCDECRKRAEALRKNASSAAKLLRESAPIGDLDAVLARVKQTANGDVGVFAEHLRPKGANAAIFWALAAAAAVVLAFVFTPLGTVAQGFLAIFEPHQFQPVAVTARDRQSVRFLPPLESYGTLREVRPQIVHVANAAQAAALARIPLRLPTRLPAGIPPTIQFSVSPPATSSFTFSSAKTRAASAAMRRLLPPMPMNLDGSTLLVSVGPVVAVTYGAPRRLNRDQTTDNEMRHVNIPQLVVVQAPLPRVMSTGASVRQIEDYLLRQPGIPPSVAAQIAAIGDPTTTLPIPVAIDRETAQAVMVQGVRGLAIGDNTGVGAGVVWQRDGFIYGVAGGLPESEVLAIANSLR